MLNFQLKSKWSPAGDQPQAIERLISGLENGDRFQTLLGITGSGKTFTAANVISAFDRPTLVIAHNKTLAAQLAEEYQEFFPDHAVHYFVSYYDYYQPEAYVAASDTYIEKDASINEEIDRLRHASTQALLTRKDVIIVASVSCIYGLGSPKEYEEENLRLSVGMDYTRDTLVRRLVSIFFERTNVDLTPGSFRALGNRVEVMPVSERYSYSLELSDGKIAKILTIDPVSQKILETPDSIFLFPTKHFITDKERQASAIASIRAELEMRLGELEREGKVLEHERLKRRANYDLAMMEEIGYCSGIENYSRHLSGKKPGEAPDTLLEYFPHITRTVRTENGLTQTVEVPDFLTIIDESHVTLPQLRSMYAGDRSRKETLVEFGFRLPSALDNRPLRFEEFLERVGQVIFTSATPSDYERSVSSQMVEQVIRPTGLLDPELSVRGVQELGEYPGQISDFIAEAEQEIKGGGRVLATTLTKKMAEDLSVYLKEKKIQAEYLHSDIKTIDRIKILTAFRKGTFDILVGVNLLREGLDLPEVSLIGILDADKEGFLRSETSLIQIIGRAARNSLGRVILYADRMTDSMRKAIDTTRTRRALQETYNRDHGITPMTIEKRIHDITEQMESEHDRAVCANLMLDEEIFRTDPKKLMKLKKREMNAAVEILDFETAAILRDEIRAIERKILSDTKGK